jgi:hypothetical protein
MDRRQILTLTAYVTGAAVATPLASALLSSCNATQSGNELGKGLYFFKDDEFSFLGKFLDSLLPRTISPSAMDVGVDRTIDSMVGTAYPEDARKAYRTGFRGLMNILGEREDMMSDLMALEKGEHAEEITNAYMHVKQQAVAYYLSTEKIGKEFLNYVPVPGEYIGCISLEEAGGKAWAL